MIQDILRSKEDKSINIVTPSKDGGAIETRFVQRLDDTVIVYLSSATGCDRACRFCHLTQTGQTMMTHETVDGYLKQATELFDLMVRENKLNGVVFVHFNFMARGDALLNPHFINHTKAVLDGLNLLAVQHGLSSRFKISTIFPTSDLLTTDNEWRRWVLDTLMIHPEVEIYYSLYSFNRQFRKRWIPKSMNPEQVGLMFAGTTNRLRLHHALIEGENDSQDIIDDIWAWLERYDIRCYINLIRYNPFSSSCGREPTFEYIEQYRHWLSLVPNVTGARIITKIGEDVKASCGTFVF